MAGDRTAPGWRWANVPLPERYLGALVAGTLLQCMLPLRIPMPRWAARIVGGQLLVGGIGMAGWAVASAGRTSVDRTEALVTTGADELTRNPMYLGWGAGLLGLALLTRNPWLLVAWLHGSRAIHAEVLEEEDALAARFGTSFDEYRSRTSRYLRWGSVSRATRG